MEKTYKFGMTKEEFTSLHNTPGPAGDEIIDIAEDMLNGKMYIKGTNFYTGYSADNFDWEFSPDDDTKDTFQLYLFALYPIVYSMRAFDITGNTKYAEFATKLMYSWLDFTSKPETTSKNPFILRDHCIALRTESLIYFALVLNDAGMLTEDLYVKLIRYIELHVKQLCNRDYYTQNHNHGVFQDRALLYAACFLDGENKQELIDIARERVILQRNFAFTEEMVSVENSYDYHIIALKLFREISNILTFTGDESSKKLIDDFHHAADFLAYFLKPDGYIPLTGDSKAHKFSRRDAELYGGFLEYSVNRGALGEKPTPKNMIYPKSGYLAYRQYWSPEDSRNGRMKFVNSAWAAFKSGYVSTTHKHADDLSFMMYAKGHDIFVDTGVFSYSKQSRLNQYFRSALAHNTVIVDGKSYKPTLADSCKTGFFASEDNENYCYAGGFNNSYKGVEIDRHFYAFDESVIIFDNIKSEKMHTYSQLFHLGPDISIISMTDEEVVLKLADTGFFVRITQMLKNTLLKHFYGENETGSYGIISQKLNEVSPIHTLKFDVTATNADIVTVISVLKPNGRLDETKRIKFAKKKNAYVFDVRKYSGEDFRITASPSVRIKELYTVFEQNGKNIQMINKTPKCKNAKFGWEIFDEEGMLVHEEPYSDVRSFKYKIKDLEKFRVFALMKTEDGMSYRSPVKDFTGSVLHDLSEGLFILSSNEERSYTFTMNSSLSGCSFIWHVYKKSEDGWVSVYKTDETEDSSFKCTFSSGGKFRVKVACKNKRADKYLTSIDVDVK